MAELNKSKPDDIPVGILGELITDFFVSHLKRSIKFVEHII